MADRLHLLPKHREALEALLREHLPDVEVWAYGSRVNGRSHDGSDLDLVLRGSGLTEIPSDQLWDFEEAVRESTIPFLVEARDWARLPESFHRKIEQDYVVLAQRHGVLFDQDCQGAKDTIREWIHCTLADVCSVVNYGLTASASRHSIGPKFLRITDIVSGHLDWEKVPHVEANDDVIEKYRLDDGDIVIARTGASTGISLYVKRPPIAVFASYLVRLRVSLDFDARFISYYMKSKKFLDFIDSVLGDKSAQPNASATTMTAAPLRVPKDKAEQRAIAHILGTLDDKIELNRRMNETLEAMARAIFKDWFVDFGPTRAKAEGRAPYLAPEIWDLFPDALDDEGKPVGWQNGTLGDCFYLTMGQSPPGSTYNDEGEGLPFFQGRTDFGFRYPENRKFCTAPTRTAEVDDTLVSVRAPVGDINMAWEKCCAGRGIAALRHKSGSRSFTYYSAWAIEQELKEYEHTGTVFGAINKSQFEALNVAEPKPKMAALFECEICPFDERIRKNVSESRTLTQTRDLLLPRLISGDLQVGIQKSTLMGRR